MIRKKRTSSHKQRTLSRVGALAGMSSREKLVQSATRLFADRGFHGVSVRDIANEADVNSALIGYYFHNKDGLLAEVYMRHFEPLKQERARLLAEANTSSSGPKLEKVLEAFIRPSLQTAASAEDNRNFYRLRAILSAENHVLLEQLVAQTFDEASRAFIGALSACLPHLTCEDIYWRFHFLLGAIYYSATGPRRIQILSAGVCDPSDAIATTRELIHCAAAAFRAPSTHPRTAPAAKKKSATR